MSSNGTQTDSVLQRIIERSDWRKTLATDYNATAQRLTSAYKGILPALQTAAGDFTQRINDWVVANPDSTLTASYVRGFKEYQDMLARVTYEYNEFGKIVNTESDTLQQSAVTAGADGALEMALKMAGKQTAFVNSGWVRPDPAALAALVGYVDGAAFRDRVGAFGDNAGQAVSDVILSYVAQGKNPRNIASVLSNWFALPYSWAENTTRTVQLWSYRTANHATFAANSDVLDGWMWSATLDARTCMSCVNQHGTKHKLDEVLNDHHRGRCAPIPIVKYTTWADNVTTGQAWFESLDENAQRQQMGNAMYEAWKSGAVTWADMSKPYNDPIYGQMLAQPSLKSILGADKAKSYGANLPTENGKIATVDGFVEKDKGTPGTTIESLNKFLDNSRGPLAGQIMDYEMGLTTLNFDTGAVAIDPSGVKDAAKRFVAESQNIQYGKDYILSLVKDQAAANGVNVSGAAVEKLMNAQYATQAKAILTTASIGNVKLTEAQIRRLTETEKGNYLNIVYTTTSSEKGSLANAALGGYSQGVMTDSARKAKREEFLRVLGRMD